MQPTQPTSRERPKPIQTSPRFMQGTSSSDKREAAARAAAYRALRRRPASLKNLSGKSIQSPKTPQEEQKVQSAKRAQSATHDVLRTARTPQPQTRTRAKSASHRHDDSATCNRCNRPRSTPKTLPPKLTRAQMLRAQKIAERDLQTPTPRTPKTAPLQGRAVRRTASTSHISKKTTDVAKRTFSRSTSTTPRKDTTRQRSSSTKTKEAGSPRQQVQPTRSARLRNYLRDGASPPGVSRRRPPGKKPKKKETSKLPPTDTKEREAPSPREIPKPQPIPREEFEKLVKPQPVAQPEPQPDEPAVMEPKGKEPQEESKQELQTTIPAEAEPVANSPKEPQPVAQPEPPSPKSPQKQTSPRIPLHSKAFSPEVLRAMQETIDEVAPSTASKPTLSPEVLAQEDLELPPIVEPATSYPDPLLERNLENLDAIYHALRCTNVAAPNELTPRVINEKLLWGNTHLTVPRSKFHDLGEVLYSKINGEYADLQKRAISREYEKLILPCCLITDEQLIALVAKLPRLREVILFDCPNITGKGLSQAFQGSHLRKLHVSLCEIDPDSLATVVEQCSTLEEVEIINQQLSHSFIAALANHEKLREIDLAYCSFPLQSLTQLYGKNHLNTLDFTGAEINPEEVKEFALNNRRVRVIEKHSNESSPALHAASRIAPIPQLTEKEAKEEYLKAIQEEAKLIQQELHNREADYIYFKTVGRSDPAEMYKAHLQKCFIEPEETELFTFDALDVSKAEAYAQAAEAFYQTIECIGIQYDFVRVSTSRFFFSLPIEERRTITHDALRKRSVVNFFSILKTPELQKKITQLQFAGDIPRIPRRLYMKEFPNLTKVTIQGHLRKIPSDFFSASPKISILNLSNNKIAYVENFAVHLQSLAELDFSGNQIKRFPVELARAFASHNKNLSTTPGDSSLTIDLTGNPLEEVPKKMDTLPIYLAEGPNKPQVHLLKPSKGFLGLFKKEIPEPSRVIAWVGPKFLEKCLSKKH